MGSFHLAKQIQWCNCYFAGLDIKIGQPHNYLLKWLWPVRKCSAYLFVCYGYIYFPFLRNLGWILELFQQSSFNCCSCYFSS